MLKTRVHGFACPRSANSALRLKLVFIRHISEKLATNYAKQSLNACCLRLLMYKYMHRYLWAFLEQESFPACDFGSYAFLWLSDVVKQLHCFVGWCARARVGWNPIIFALCGSLRSLPCFAQFWLRSCSLRSSALGWSALPVF